MSQFADIGLINEQFASVKTLKSFTKQTRVPDRASESDNRWIKKLAQADIDADLEKTFAKLRAAFSFKRREIQVGEPDEGIGVITTPHFHYEISVCLRDSDPSRVIWRRAVTGIQDMNGVFSPAFEEVFGGMFSVLEVVVDDAMDIEAIIDSVEDADSDSVKIDYDKDVSWCEITLKDSLTTIRVTENAIRASGPSEVKPRDLVESFLQVKDRFMQSMGTADNPFA